MTNIVPMPAAPWRDRLQMTTTGAIKANLFNALCAIRGMRSISDAFYWDQFRSQIWVSLPLPWSVERNRPWSEYDDVRLTETIQAADIPIPVELVQRAVGAVAMEHPRHDLRQWLSSLEWDGTKRIDRWLTFHFGVDDTPYSRAVGEAWMISAIARVMRPGCKADHILILDGPQGMGKSSAMRALVGNEYFTDELSDAGSKDAALQMQGAWIIELSELDTLSRSAIERVKAFVTRQSDRFVPKYERRVVSLPRQCVFVGTSNNTEFRDPTGNRRFWPVNVRHIDIEGIRAEREQLWAEAVDAFRSDIPWWITDPEIVAAAKDQQFDRLQTDPWDEILDDWVFGKSRVTTKDALLEAIRMTPDKMGRAEEMRIANYLKSRNWERVRDGGRDDRRWFWAKRDE